jgi:hypothetical protein
LFFCLPFRTSFPVAHRLRWVLLLITAGLNHLCASRFRRSYQRSVKRFSDMWIPGIGFVLYSTVFSTDRGLIKSRVVPGDDQFLMWHDVILLHRGGWRELPARQREFSLAVGKIRKNLSPL